MKCINCKTVFLSLCLLAPGAFAQTGVYETEPNNTPADALEVSGEVVLIGSMEGQDQDAYLWTVTDNGARKRWTFELRGIPGHLTIAQVFRLEYADNGIDVVAKDSLMKMGTRDGLTPSIARDLLFEPGEYLIGLAHAGGGSKPEGGGVFRPPTTSLSFGDEETPETGSGADDQAGAGGYRFIIREGRKLPVNSDNKPRMSRDFAGSVKPGTEYARFELRERTWYSIAFNEDHASQRWDIATQVPVGRKLDARLYNQAGEELASSRSSDRGLIVFPDIAPEAQTYFVELDPVHDSGFIHAFGSESVGQRVAGEEAEPNGEWKLANRVDLSQPLTGRVGDKRDGDYFLFELDEETADQLLALRIETATPGQSLKFCLLGTDRDNVQCRDGKTPLELPDLVLAPGQWGLSVSRGTAGVEYRITLSGQGPIAAGMEAEPNDSISHASGIPANSRVKGRLSGDDDDYFRFTVTDGPQLWRFQVIGDGLNEVAYYNAAGNQLARSRPRGGQSRVRLENLFLLPGQHYLRISGKDGGKYTVLARALGPPDPNGEMEPNGDTSRMQRLAIGQTRTGLISNPDDKDLYRFFLANHDHIRLTVQPPADGIVAPSLYWYGAGLAEGNPGAAGEPVSITGVFPPGDYHVSLASRKDSDAEYQLSLERLPRFSCATDCEPNGMNQMYLAAPMPPNGVLEGNSGDWRDVDSYQLPVLEEPSGLFIRSEAPVRFLKIGGNRHDSELLKYDSAAGGYQATVPAGDPHRLIVESRGVPYRLELEFAGKPLPQNVAPLPATLELELDSDQVAAYLTHGQQVNGRLKITNTGDAVLTANLEAVTSDYRWLVNLERKEIALARNGHSSIPLTIQVPPDAWAERMVRISVRAFDENQAQVEAWAELGVDREVPPVNAYPGWQIPEKLRGGLNAAWLPFGAQWTNDALNGGRYTGLRDGLAFAGIRTHCCPDHSDDDGFSGPGFTLELPGDQALPVAGIALNHFGSPGPYTDVRKATLLLSVDGLKFQEALHLETLPVETEQYFPLDEPVMARFARLRVDQTFNLRYDEGGFNMSEWKVILQPGHDLSAGQGFNLADPALGGHLVSDSPPRPYSPRPVLKEDAKANSVRLKSGELQEYVIGFHHNRAARIQRIEWVYSVPESRKNQFNRVSLSVSTESSTGPWTAIGEIILDSPDAASAFSPGEPVWARFVKLTATPAKPSGPVEVPDIIRVWEQPTNDDYRSVLGEWGYASRRAFFEDQRGMQSEPEFEAAGNDSRLNAAAIQPGQLAAGQVALGKHEHWYRFEVPDGQNTLTITVTGDPTVRTSLALEDARGDAVNLKKNDKESSTSVHVFSAIVDPGAELYFHVSEPPRNVVFTWDTSASVGAFLPTIYNSLSAFAGQVVPGREAVNLLPFGKSSPLLRDWHGEPYVLQTILSDKPRDKSSSSAELTLKYATQLLSPLPGTKAIVIITDGITVHHGQVWNAMAEVQPRVFGIGVGGSEGWNVDVFEDWSSVNGGHYSQLVYDGEMEVAFDRAATLMRRPAAYTLEFESEYRKAPGPGSLLVTSAKDGTAGRSAVELILDASGSMLKRLEGTRRIAIAKQVLSEAVTAHIPPGTPVALRVFGHKEVDACRTDLEIPLSPLDPAAAVRKIEGIQAMNLARTPIADSLAAVAGDMKGVDGQVAIVLVTDGEETCDGDPAKVIEALEKKDIKINLNIVGFAIDNNELESQFSDWAKQGNGRYFSADNQQGLSEVIAEALQVPYSVYDRGGNLVAQGLVDGEPLELEQGPYRVVVSDARSTVFDRVDIEGEKTTGLELE